MEMQILLFFHIQISQQNGGIANCGRLGDKDVMD